MKCELCAFIVGHAVDCPAGIFDKLTAPTFGGAKIVVDSTPSGAPDWIRERLMNTPKVGDIATDARGYREQWDGKHWRKLDTLASPVLVTPRCHNREPFEGTWFENRCATWDGVGIGPNGERYPVAHNFNCVGCRWLPEEHKNEAAEIAANASR